MPTHMLLPRQSGILIMAFLLAMLLAVMPVSARVRPLGPYVIFSGKLVPDMLSQCSRDTPLHDAPTWQPTSRDIAVLERALPGFLKTRKTDMGDPPPASLAQINRQYVGFTKAGRRYVYGNYFPEIPATDKYYTPEQRASWRATPMIVCDGGPAYFGVAYDVAARRFTHLAFNGSV
jgi:hypothetical protein